MGEMPEWVRHQRESERFRRLCAIASDPAVKSRFAEIALVHARMADRMRALSKYSGYGAPAGAAQRGTEYRLQLFDGRQLGPSLAIEADMDSDALRIAWLVQEAASDIYTAFELWQEERCIANSRDRRGAKRPANLADISASTQLRVLKIEEMLLASRAAIAESRKLLDATAKLRSALNGR
jgi:hypothetical protein